MKNEDQFMSHVDGILEEYAALLRANAKLEKKIAALRQETIEECAKKLDTFDGITATECAALLRLDANRYRWLRSYNAFAVTEKDGEGGYTLMGDEYLDAAIDDAMEKKVK
jgi:hypothetical protein